MEGRTGGENRYKTKERGQQQQTFPTHGFLPWLAQLWRQALHSVQYQLHPISTQIAVVKGTLRLVDGAWIKQQGEELASHLVSGRNGRNARQQFLIRGGADAVSKGVDQRCPARPLRPVFVGTMNH
jgi:hypothetical protein